MWKKQNTDGSDVGSDVVEREASFIYFQDTSDDNDSLAHGCSFSGFSEYMITANGNKKDDPQEIKEKQTTDVSEVSSNVVEREASFIYFEDTSEDEDSLTLGASSSTFSEKISTANDRKEYDIDDVKEDQPTDGSDIDSRIIEREASFISSRDMSVDNDDILILEASYSYFSEDRFPNNGNKECDDQEVKVRETNEYIVKGSNEKKKDVYVEPKVKYGESCNTDESNEFKECLNVQTALGNRCLDCMGIINGEKKNAEGFTVDDSKQQLSGKELMGSEEIRRTILDTKGTEAMPVDDAVRIKNKKGGVKRLLEGAIVPYSEEHLAQATGSLSLISQSMQKWNEKYCSTNSYETIDQWITVSPKKERLLHESSPLLWSKYTVLLRSTEKNCNKNYIKYKMQFRGSVPNMTRFVADLDQLTYKELTWISNKYYGLIMGHRNSNVTRIEKMFDVLIKVPSKYHVDATENIKVFGIEKDVSEAMRKIVSIVDSAIAEESKSKRRAETPKKVISRTLSVEKSMFPLIIGEKGKRINSIKMGKDVDVSFDRNKDLIIITSYEYDDVVMVRNKMIDAIRNLPSPKNYSQLDFYWQHFYLARKDRRKVLYAIDIHRIEREHAVRVRIPNQSDYKDIIWIKGSRPSAKAAYDKILHLARLQ